MPKFLLKYIKAVGFVEELCMAKFFVEGYNKFFKNKKKRYDAIISSFPNDNNFFKNKNSIWFVKMHPKDYRIKYNTNFLE